VPLRICQIAAEVTPYAKTGGLGDVVAGLSRHLGHRGHEVMVFLPAYAHLARREETFVPVEPLHSVPVQMGSRFFTFSVATTSLPDSEVPVYFVDCPPLYGWEGIYQGDWTDWLRFGLLTRAAFECCQRLGFAPDIIHGHDWHTALAPLYLKSLYSWDRLFDATRCVLTVHNMGYQGLVSSQVLDDLGLSHHGFWLDAADSLAGRFNFLKTGLLHADAITAVSRTYAHEIQTPELGVGLDWLTRARSSRLAGIVNGVDYGTWNPETDPHIPHHYSAADLAGKRAMKRALLSAIGMDEETEAPIVGIVSRLTAQKGFDLCFDVLPEALAHRDLRLVVLGSGEDRYQDFFQWLPWRFPGKAWYYKGYNEELAHWIEAGADLFLMPSRYEPCGLNQMYSLRYGTIPVVRAVGGLADTVREFDPITREGNGFTFERFDAHEMVQTLRRALAFHRQPELWRTLQRNGMQHDFSWRASADGYDALYAEARARVAAGNVPTLESARAMLKP
jgi:starch synthase